jgi:hypothetical protein
MPRCLALAAVALGIGAAGAAFAFGPAGPNLLTPPPSSPPLGVLGYRVPLMTTPVTVFAIVGNRLLFGTSRPDPVGRAAAVLLKDDGTPELSCAAGYGYAARVGGQAHFTCSDGSRFEVSYHGVSDDSGVGRGVSGGLPVSFCFGFPARAAARRLAPPPGYALVVDQGQLALRPAGT